MRCVHIAELRNEFGVGKPLRSDQEFFETAFWV